MKKKILILLISLSLFSCEVWAEEESGQTTAKDQATSAESLPSRTLPLRPDSMPAFPESLPHWMSHPFLFPIKFPYYTEKTLTYPLFEIRRQALRNHIIRRTLFFVSNQSKSYSIRPLIDISSSGFGAGFAFTHLNLLHRSYELRTRYLIYTDTDQRASLSFSNSHAFYVGKHAFSFDLSTRWWQQGNRNFYGIGPDSLEADKTAYSLTDLRNTATMGLQLVRNLEFDGIFGFDSANTGPKTRGTEPNITDIFPQSTIPGFSQRIDWVNLGVRLLHDTRDNIFFPETGGLRELDFNYYLGVNNSGFDYFQLKLDARQYFSLARRYVFILHNAWVFQQAPGGNVVPFFRLAYLDHNTFLRGFPRGRFRDRGSVIFNAEFRYPLWDTIDGTVFVDSGRVFNGIRHFSFKDFRYSVGGGIRMVVNRFFNFRLEAAYGGEGINVVFTAQQPL